VESEEVLSVIVSVPVHQKSNAQAQHDDNWPCKSFFWLIQVYNEEQQAQGNEGSQVGVEELAGVLLIFDQAEVDDEEDSPAQSNEEKPSAVVWICGPCEEQQDVDEDVQSKVKVQDFFRWSNEQIVMKAESNSACANGIEEPWKSGPHP